MTIPNLWRLVMKVRGSPIRFVFGKCEFLALWKRCFLGWSSRETKAKHIFRIRGRELGHILAGPDLQKVPRPTRSGGSSLCGYRPLPPKSSTFGFPGVIGRQWLARPREAAMRHQRTASHHIAAGRLKPKLDLLQVRGKFSSPKTENLEIQPNSCLDSLVVAIAPIWESSC